MGSLGVLRSVGIPKGYQGFGFDDSRALERLNPRLTFVEEQLGAQAPESDQFAWPTRMIARLFARWRAQGRPRRLDSAVPLLVTSPGSTTVVDCVAACLHW